MFPVLMLTSGLVLTIPEQRQDELAYPPTKLVPADMLRNARRPGELPLRTKEELLMKRIESLDAQSKANDKLAKTYEQLFESMEQGIKLEDKTSPQGHAAAAELEKSLASMKKTLRERQERVKREQEEATAKLKELRNQIEEEEGKK